ncbi:MAG: ribonuclease III [Alphaproteobacteria bacterium]|nr:ribonuclease III [Alphaproteobacteria bacterium]
MKPELQLLCQELGHDFTDISLLNDALTLASGSHRAAYERLEFLGDRVLGLAVADMLYRTYKKEEEGSLARRHTSLVRTETVAKVAEITGIAKCIDVPKSEKANMARSPQSFLCDVCEAVLGALYLDAGYEKAFRFIKKHWEPLMAEEVTPPIDAKTVLQEWVQKQKLALPVYEVLQVTGPDHQPTFVIEVAVDGYAKITGKGSSKRHAEQDAAKKFLNAAGVNKK